MCLVSLQIFFTNTQKKPYITEVKLSKKKVFLEDRTVLTLTSGEKVHLLVITEPPRYYDVNSGNMDTVL